LNNFNNKDDYFNKNENDFNNDMNNCEDKKNLFSIKNKFMGTIFIIIIVVSIIGIFKFLYTKPSMSVFFFGVIFFFSGIYIIASASINKNSLPVLIFPFAGAVIMLFSGIYTFGNSENKAFVIKIFPFIILATLFLVGASLVVGKILINKYNKTHCTESIMAECTEIKSSYDDGTTTYCPVFSFYYNGQTYMVCDEQYSNVNVPQINKKYEIFINPNKPTEYYIKSSINSFIIIIFGVVFMIVSTLITFLYLSPK
jgi:hypothetical protein